MTQGGQANITGGTLEQTVRSVLTSKGFREVPYLEYTRYVKKNGQLDADDKYGTELLLKNAQFCSIYGHSSKTEFLMISKKHNIEIRIECKWQQTSGSVDEKFPYTYLNCIEAMPEQIIIIIIDGGGFKQGAIDWLKAAAKNKLYTTNRNRNKEIRVMNIAEFIAWANLTFK
ncbi:MAG: hypothetical protein NUV48_14045 [Peptococcaceae bacterium]|jgi:hypothetical protein|nr:hypothetical protein [Peptococcaceae bacterium]